VSGQGVSIAARSASEERSDRGSDQSASRTLLVVDGDVAVAARAGMLIVALAAAKTITPIAAYFLEPLLMEPPSRALENTTLLVTNGTMWISAPLSAAARAPSADAPPALGPMDIAAAGCN